MSRLTNPVTGHWVNTDDESVGFWTAAGYRAESEPKKAPAKKAPAKKANSKK